MDAVTWLVLGLVCWLALSIAYAIHAMSNYRGPESWWAGPLLLPVICLAWCAGATNGLYRRWKRYHLRPRPQELEMFSGKYVGGPNDGSDWVRSGTQPDDGAEWLIPQFVECDGSTLLRSTNSFARYKWSRAKQTFVFDRSLTPEDAGCRRVDSP